MKIDDKLSHRARMLLFSTLELLRKEVRKSEDFSGSDWKDADDWIFGQLDFTKGELAQIYKGRNTLYYDGSAVDFEAAQKEYEDSLPSFLKGSHLEVYTFVDCLYIGDIKLFLDENKDLFCKMSDESNARRLRDHILDVKEGDAFFFGNSGAIRTASSDVYFDDITPRVYGNDGEVYSPDDVSSAFALQTKQYLLDLITPAVSKDRTIEELLSQDISREHMTENEHKAFVAYWFDEYERTGFSGDFKSPYEDLKCYNDQTFDVIGRCSEDTHDLETLPAWKIRLEHGAELDAYPEEICELERNPDLNKSNSKLSDKIQDATARSRTAQSHQHASAKEPDHSI